MAKSGARRKRSFRRIALWTIVGLVALFVVIQFVPYGRDHTAKAAPNPFQWSAPAAEAIARESCYDCHSNETKWWWGVKIAPMSWLAQHDIDGAQDAFNFSDWTGGVTAEEIREAINGEMPPLQFTLLHPGAKLSDAEKKTLVAGFQASLAANGSGGTTPAPAASPTPTATATSSAADATTIIASRCGACHTADRALQFRASSAADAQALIDNMVQRGATVTPEEQQALVAYFTR